MKITDFFKVYQNRFNDPGEAFYHGSLVPIDDVAPQIKQIDFFVEYDNHLKNEPEIHHRNQVNSHIFKPRYYFTNKKGVINCSVANEQVLMHTLRSLAFWFFFTFRKDIEITVTKKEEKYLDYCREWDINPKILIGRTESVINCLRYLVLLDLGYSKKIVQRHILEQEDSRLRNTPTPYGDHFTLADQILNVVRYGKNNPRISMINCVYKKSPLSIIQLPWGVDMSRDQISAIFHLNPLIKKIGIVGGIGYVGHHPVSVDDIMVPETLVRGDDFSEYKVIHLKNRFRQSKTQFLSWDKQVCNGSLYSVIPQKNILSNSLKVTNNGGKIDGFDMELDGFVDALNEHPEVLTSFVYYIMDIPEKGLGLGHTYYNFDFLTKLFSNVNRGKHFCIENTVNWLVGNR